MWQADLVEVADFSSVTNELRYMLTVIDAFSKYAWAMPIENKKPEAVTKAMEFLFPKGRIPNTTY